MQVKGESMLDVFMRLDFCEYHVSGIVVDFFHRADAGSVEGRLRRFLRAVAILLRSLTACPCARRSLSRATKWLSVTYPWTRPHLSLSVVFPHLCSVRVSIPAVMGVVWLVLTQPDLSRPASSTSVSRFVSCC